MQGEISLNKFYEGEDTMLKPSYLTPSVGRVLSHSHWPYGAGLNGTDWGDPSRLPHPVCAVPRCAALRCADERGLTDRVWA